MIPRTPKPGDVWLVRVPYVKKAKFISWLIGLFQRPVERYGEVMTYSHAGLFTGSGMQVVHAAASGIEYNWVQAAHRDHELWVIAGITDAQREIVVHHAAKKIGQKYGWVDLVSGGHIRTKDDVCSELVAGALKASGIDLGGIWTPNDLARHPKLERVV